MAITKKESKEIRDLISSLLVYQSIIENKQNDIELIIRFMNWYNEKCTELEKFNITMIRYKGV
jgi:hypothetical protein